MLLHKAFFHQIRYCCLFQFRSRYIINIFKRCITIYPENIDLICITQYIAICSFLRRHTFWNSVFVMIFNADFEKFLFLRCKISELCKKPLLKQDRYPQLCMIYRLTIHKSAISFHLFKTAYVMEHPHCPRKIPVNGYIRNCSCNAFRKRRHTIRVVDLQPDLRIRCIIFICILCKCLLDSCSVHQLLQ